MDIRDNEFLLERERLRLRDEETSRFEAICGLGQLLCVLGLLVVVILNLLGID